MPKGYLWMCNGKYIYINRYKSLSNIFKLFFKNQSFKNSHFNTTDEGGEILFSWKWGTGKLNQTNRWVERSPKMRNLHRYHYLQKFSKYEKTTKTCQLGSKWHHPPLPPQRFNKKLENINANNIRMFVDLSANSFIFARITYVFL